MSTCTACWRHALLTLSRTASRDPLPSLRTAVVSPLRLNWHSRLFASSATLADVSDIEHVSHPIFSSKGTLDIKKHQKKLRYAVGKHLERLRDPWNIAQHVERTLRQNGDSRFEEVLLLVQTASKSTPVTVSWNHLIEHLFKMKRLRPAIKLFNEMKKRGQKPNQQTYTIIFRGCAENPHKDLALTEAIRIYNMISRDSLVRPNLIHANAVLHVCVRAGDTDAMFALLDKMEENKELRLNAASYSTILQGMRLQLEAIQPATEGLPTDVSSQAVDELLGRCEAVWGDVIRKWRKGSLDVAESLVGTMGKLLLHGKVQHQRDVFALLRQTMGLPRFDNDTGTGKQAPEISTSSGVFEPFAIPDEIRIRPGTRTLDLILETTTKMRLVKVGVRYWQHHVDVLGVRPDQNNWLKLLKLLHLGSSSSESARFLKAMPTSFITPFSLRLAFSTCLRNMKNPKVLTNAQDMLQILLQEAGSGPPDVKSLWLFLQVVNSRLISLRKENHGSWRVVCQEVASSLNSTWVPYGRAADDVLLPRLVEEKAMPYTDSSRIIRLGEVVDVARGIIAAASKILPYIDAKTRSVMEQRCRQLNRQVVAFTDAERDRWGEGNDS